MVPKLCTLKFETFTKYPPTPISNPTMVQPPLPPEIIDGIIEHLHDDKGALKQCSLASKQLASHTQRYLFNAVEITSKNLEGWKKTFPNSATSLAHYARSLTVHPTDLVTAKDGIDGGWIKPFTNVERLELRNLVQPGNPIPTVSLTPFHALSSIKSLRVTFTAISPLEIINLICSLPLLEDLGINALNTEIDDIDEVILQPVNPPPLTGTLHLRSGVKRVANILSHVPVHNGLRFRKIILDADSLEEEEELEYAPDLVERCSNTLEYIQIRRSELGELFPHGGSMFGVNICPL